MQRSPLRMNGIVVSQAAPVVNVRLSLLLLEKNHRLLSCSTGFAGIWFNYELKKEGSFRLYRKQ